MHLHSAWQMEVTPKWLHRGSGHTAWGEEHRKPREREGPPEPATSLSGGWQDRGWQGIIWRTALLSQFLSILMTTVGLS